MMRKEETSPWWTYLERLLVHLCQRGLKEFKHRVEDLLYDELLNVHKWGTFHPKHPDDMTNKEKYETLKFHVFMMGKWDNTVKAR